MTIEEIKEAIEAKQAKFDKEFAKYDEETYTKEAQETCDALISELKDLNEKLGLKENFITKQADKAAAQARKGTPEQQVIRGYSFSKAIKDIADRGQLERGSVEEEMTQEANRLAKEEGITDMRGTIQVPTWFIEMRSDKQIRAMSVGTTTAGGHTVATENMPLIQVLRPRLKVVEMGTRVESGMVGNLKFPRHTTVETASMNSEVGAGNEVTPTLDTFSASPHRIEAYTTISKQLLFQSRDISENWIRRNLTQSIEIKLDSQVLTGDGTGNNIEGIAARSGIGAPAWNASDPFGTIIDLETAIAVDNADVEQMGYLTTPGMKGFLKQTRLDTGSGAMVWGQGAMDLNGYNAQVSTQVPAATSDTHYIYFGNWSDGAIYQWSIIDIVVDQFSLRRSAQIEVVVNGWYDYEVDHNESFSLVDDGDIAP